MVYFVQDYNSLLCVHVVFQLYLSKEQVKKEVELKNEALKQQTSMQQLLHMKSKVSY